MEIIIILVVTYFTGSIIEKKHLKRLKKRERAILQVPLLNHGYQGDENIVANVVLVKGSSVIAVDYFKSFIASLRNIFGGQVSTFESVIDRARREAILRMRESAVGADEIVKVRIQTSQVGKRQVEVLAYGTAIYKNK